MAGKVLLVDDEVFAVEEIADYLRRHGQDVLATSNSTEGLQWVSTDPSIDVVITDLKMANVDGFQIISEAAQQRREGNRDLRIIAITGHGTEEDEKRAKTLGADTFMVKPVSVRELMKILSQRA